MSESSEHAAEAERWLEYAADSIEGRDHEFTQSYALLAVAHALLALRKTRATPSPK